MSFLLPTGFDRGDGKSNIPFQPQGSTGSGKFGTPNPDKAVVQSFPGASQPPEENPDSPIIERAEQGTISHKFKMAWEDGLNYIAGLSRGVFFQDSGLLQAGGTVTRVLSATLKALRGDQAELEVIAESISFDSPPDEFQCVPIDLGIDIIKDPRYSWALSPAAGDEGTYTTVGEQVISFVNVKSALIRMIQNYRDSPIFPTPDGINGLIQSTVLNALTKGADGKTLIPIAVPVDAPDFDPTLPSDPPLWNGVGTDLPEGNYNYAIINVPVDLSSDTDIIACAVAAAKEIISKLWRQEDTPYRTGSQVTLSVYYFRPTFLNPGGYIESPVGIVPDFFLSPSQAGPDTIFDMYSTFNPQAYSFTGISGGPVNISWLRKSDEVEYQRTWFRVTSTWVGSPIGSWDIDLYNQGNRPQKASDFDQLI